MMRLFCSVRQRSQTDQWLELSLLSELDRGRVRSGFDNTGGQFKVWLYRPRQLLYNGGQNKRGDGVPVQCYQCGHQQTSGRVCERCGLMTSRNLVDQEDQPGATAPVTQPQQRCGCGHVQMSGRFCERCGLAISVYRSQTQAEPELVLCRQCGSRSRTAICRNCGMRIPGFEEESP